MTVMQCNKCEELIIKKNHMFKNNRKEDEGDMTLE
jgi:hypothetical protein